METPNILKGGLYPSSRICKCPRFHRCIVSQKCQNYDKHLYECVVCESRVRPAHNLGGELPEGKVWPDLQDAVKTIQDLRRQALAHPDSNGQTFSSYDIASNMDRMRKATELLSFYSNMGNLTMEEKVMTALLTEEDAEKYTGRLE